jgi:O-antigen/teichoic acid export membrane protein
LRRLLGHALNLLLLTAVPLLLIMSLHGELLIRIVLGDKWTSIGPVLGLLSLGMLLRSLTEVQATVLRAIGEPRFDFTLSAAQVAITGAALAPCILWRGMAGAPLALIAGSGATLLLAERLMRRRLGFGIWSQTAAVGGTAIGVLAALLVQVGSTSWGSSVSAELLRALAEVTAFLLVQGAVFLMTNSGLLATPAWATRRFLERRRSAPCADMPPQPA